MEGNDAKIKRRSLYLQGTGQRGHGAELERKGELRAASWVHVGIPSLPGAGKWHGQGRQRWKNPPQGLQTAG